MFRQQRNEEGPRQLTDAEAFRSGMVANLAATSTAALERQLGFNVVDEERAAELAAATPPQPEATIYQFPTREQAVAEANPDAPLATVTPLPGFAEVAQMPIIEHTPTYPNQQAA